MREHIYNRPESGIYKENKKVRKQENKNSTKKAIKKTRKKKKENTLSTQKAPKKKRKLSFFLGRVLVFLFSFINFRL